MAFLIGGANSAADTGYDVDNSCRFNAGDSAYMTRTFGSAGNRRTWTFSTWCKRAKFGAQQTLFGSSADGSNYHLFYWGSDETLTHNFSGTTTSASGLFRDPSAWYHVVCAVDTTQGTAANRVRLYVNGAEVGSGSYPDEDAEMILNNNVRCDVGSSGAHFTSHMLGGYLAETVFIDGTQYAASDFGEYDSDSPLIWKPKDVSGLTFGTNGFWFDYEDSGTLGNDANGGTDWTATNLAATDQASDSPTNNFCTINPLVVRIGRTAPTLSEGNLKGVHGDTGGNTPAWGTFLLTAGSWYWEVKVTTGNYSYIGIWQPEYDNGDVDDSLNGIVIYRQDGKKQAETAATAADYGDSYTGGSDIVSVAVNCDTGTIWFAKNGTWQASATEAEIEAGTTTNAAYTGKSFSKGIIPSISAYSGATHEYNFGSPPYAISSGNADGNGYGNFEYSVPDGFLAVCTKNLGSDGG